MCWDRRVEAQRSQRAILEPSKESREYDTIKRTGKQSNSPENKKDQKGKKNNYMYCCNIHEPHSSPAHGKSYEITANTYLFDWLCWNQSRKVSGDGSREKHRAAHGTCQDA